MKLTAASYDLLRFEGHSPSRRTNGTVVEPARGPQSFESEENLSPLERTLIEAILAPAGIDVAGYRSTPLRRRLPAVLRALHSDTLADGLVRLASSELAACKALDALLIGHTVPFRDLEVFEAIDKLVMPRLARLDRPLRVLSIGCSYGEELLSAALVLAKWNRLHDSLLRGSDCRGSAIEQARRAARRFWANVPDAFEDLRLAVDEREFHAAVARILWTVDDAVTLREPATWDLVFCRNLAIYLKPSAAEQLWNRAIHAIARDGYLVVGKAEKPMHDGTIRRMAKCIYQLEKTSHAQ